MATTTSDKYAVPGLERGLRILSEFSRETPSLGAPELARRLQVPRTTIFRLLVTLESLGYLERVPGNHEFQLGTAVLKLGFEYLASLSITELGRPILERLRDDAGYSANLVIRDGRDIIYVQKASSPSVFTSSVHVGTRLPAHATILGRALLCHLSYEQLETLYPEEKLRTYTPRTPQTLAELYALLKDDRARGYIVEEGFFEPNISTLAAPVLDAQGVVRAAVGITVPGASIPQEKRETLTVRLRAAALELSRCLNY
ncbi:IclR family transcriptional regulator [Pusillimonas sp. CC-YST705]|uniref:IclR family transcriptional regulator n=1 Tax=Mesopusillimonas faecipullorum TaxID=2755040 RepID=A0ABS8CAS9_9BURK|nr:IclR family transcriptional regulator [Mesopusillimonas faecipullorum]MCB5363142.1 IclR family transcriptional regulator [Mesopusillimonas faecipullorum]